MSSPKSDLLSNNTAYKNLFEELELLSLPDDKKVILLDKAAQLVEQRFALSITKLLAQKDEINSTELGLDKSIELLNTQVPDWPQILEQEIQQVRQELRDLVKNDPELNT